MKSTTSSKTIEALRSMFSHHGLPEQVVSDNGPQFTSDEFSQFMKSNGIKHIRCAPYHPASNGLAERFVQTLKRALKAGEKDGRTIHHRLVEFLLSYRSTIHATTNASPSELFLGRHLRTRFDLMKPDVHSTVLSKQANQKLHHDKHVKPRNMFPGTPVKWIPGTIAQKLGPVTYSVDIGAGRLIKRHIDHLTQRHDPSQVTEPTPLPVPDLSIEDDYQYPDGEIPVPPDVCEPGPPPARRYPQCVHHPPERFTT